MHSGTSEPGRPADKAKRPVRWDEGAFVVPPNFPIQAPAARKQAGTSSWRPANGGQPCAPTLPPSDSSGTGSRVVFACRSPRFQPVARLSRCGGVLVPVVAFAAAVHAAPQRSFCAHGTTVHRERGVGSK